MELSNKLQQQQQHQQIPTETLAALGAMANDYLEKKKKKKKKGTIVLSQKKAKKNNWNNRCCSGTSEECWKWCIASLGGTQDAREYQEKKKS